MPIETICSGCSKRLSVADEYAGRQARCPVCSQIYTIPYPQSSQPLNGTVDQVSGNVARAGQPAENFLSSEGSVQSTNWQTAAPATPQGALTFWMQTTDGTVYGPVDRETLDRWFHEGRVGPGYRIRQGEQGLWGDCNAFRPNTPVVNSPSAYASTSSHSPLVSNYPKSDSSVLVIAMGILGFIVCPLFSLAAFLFGASALRDIRSGQMDPKNKGLIQAGYYLGIVNCVLTIAWMAGLFIVILVTLLQAPQQF